MVGEKQRLTKNQKVINNSRGHNKVNKETAFKAREKETERE